MPTPSIRILLVEDHEDTRNMLARLLRLMKYTVKTADSVATAIKVLLAERDEIDILVSDLGLPDGSGHDILRRLPPNYVKGIVLSGFGQEDDRRRSREVGFLRHLTKPVNIQLLSDTINEVYSDNLKQEPVNVA